MLAWLISVELFIAIVISEAAEGARECGGADRNDRCRGPSVGLIVTFAGCVVVAVATSAITILRKRKSR